MFLHLPGALSDAELHSLLRQGEKLPLPTSPPVLTCLPAKEGGNTHLTNESSVSLGAFFWHLVFFLFVDFSATFVVFTRVCLLKRQVGPLHLLCCSSQVALLSLLLSSERPTWVWLRLLLPEASESAGNSKHKFRYAPTFLGEWTQVYFCCNLSNSELQGLRMHRC